MRPQKCSKTRVAEFSVIAGNPSPSVAGSAPHTGDALSDVDCDRNCAGTRFPPEFQRMLGGPCLCRHGASLRPTLANRGNTSAGVQPAIFVKESKQIV